MVGSFAVGKTSLVSRFVHSIFSEKYLTTIGVKVDRKDVRVGNRTVRLLLWDLAGEDDYAALQMSYLRGSSGLIYVADGTREYSLKKIDELHDRVCSTIGQVAKVLVLNKADLKDQWEVKPEQIEKRRDNGWTIFETSAKAGQGVEAAFAGLVEQLIPNA